MTPYADPAKAEKLRAAIALGYIERTLDKQGYTYRLTNAGRARWVQEVAAKSGFIFR